MEKTLVIDNLSPFTPKILESLETIGISSNCVKADKIADPESMIEAHDRVILSGRKTYSALTNKVNSRIVRHCDAQRKPLLGICYGAEIITLALGGSIGRMTSPVVGFIDVDITEPNCLMRGREKSLKVYESHGFCIARLPEGFIRTCKSNFCQNEVIRNRAGTIWGTQFHPEKSGSDGLVVLKNFVQLPS